MDTWVVAVDPAVVQDEWDPFQFSHLEEPAKRNELWSDLFQQVYTLKTFISIILPCITGPNLSS